jgi:hypothetical protein
MFSDIWIDIIASPNTKLGITGDKLAEKLSHPDFKLLNNLRHNNDLRGFGVFCYGVYEVRSAEHASKLGVRTRLNDDMYVGG